MLLRGPDRVYKIKSAASSMWVVEDNFSARGVKRMGERAN